jgi:hypothetical protein
MRLFVCPLPLEVVTAALEVAALPVKAAAMAQKAAAMPVPGGNDAEKNGSVGA